MHPFYTGRIGARSEKIDEILKDVLIYGEGVYSELLFSSQRNTDEALQSLLGVSKKIDVKKELSEVVSLAFAESDGVSMDAVEQAIQAKIDEIAGKHWDFDREMPVRKAGRWSVAEKDPQKDVLLKSYYAMEDAQEALEEIDQLEKKADQTAGAFAEADRAARAAEEAYNKFNQFAGKLEAQSERRKTIERIEKDKQKLTDILSLWPVLEQKLEQARALQTEQNARTTLDKYEKVKRIVDEVNAIDMSLVNAERPEDDEIQQVKAAQRSITSLENKLCGMNLNAAIEMFGGHAIEIVSVRTGEKVELTDGVAAVGEAVKIIVPGVMEMQLSPADVDVAFIENQIKEKKAISENILAKYGADSVETLETLAKTISAEKTKYELAREKLTRELGTEPFEELETAAKEITSAVRAMPEIVSDMIDLSGERDISRFITAKETVLKGYTEDHGSINAVKVKIFDMEEDLRKTKQSVAEADDIPAEFAAVADPEAYLERLHTAYKQRQKLREDALNEKTKATLDLENKRESNQGDPRAELEEAQRNFEEQKSLLYHWKHIQEVFRKQKEGVHNNPMEDIANSFCRYLGLISADRVSSEMPDGNSLDMEIYSGNKALKYETLSEGTKETVSLAFRLAVLDHLFPNGGGVIVLDDPFTDMDEDRMQQACKLINTCAKRHQVIFLTCREEYAQMLDGKRINF